MESWTGRISSNHAEERVDCCLFTPDSSRVVDRMVEIIVQAMWTVRIVVEVFIVPVKA